MVSVAATPRFGSFVVRPTGSPSSRAGTSPVITGRYLVNHLLEASSEARPEGLAVIDGARSVTYAELDDRANRLANLLRDLGVEKGDRVAVYLEKSIEAIVAIYGTLKAGAAYVPLDPQAPATRLGYIVRDAGVSVLLSARAKANAWEPLLRDGAALEAIVALDSDEPPKTDTAVRVLTARDVEAASGTRTDSGCIDFDLAYILYTSGSTGTPKGVMLTHRNCLAFVEWAAREFEITAKDRVSSHAPLHFDLSTFDLYAAALAGAPVVLVPTHVSAFPAELRGFIESSRITVWYSVPSILTMLVLRSGLRRDQLPGLRTILFAGEVFPTAHLRELMQLLPHVRFANLYGPTETNVCTWWRSRRSRKTCQTRFRSVERSAMSTCSP